MAENKELTLYPKITKQITELWVLVGELKYVEEAIYELKGVGVRTRLCALAAPNSASSPSFSDLMLGEDEVAYANRALTNAMRDLQERIVEDAGMIIRLHIADLRSRIAELATDIASQCEASDDTP